MSKPQHVTKHPNGGWQVKGEGNKKATIVTETQKEAIKLAKEIAQNQKTELVVHGEKGQILNKNSYGNDPNPPKDTKH